MTTDHALIGTDLRYTVARRTIFDGISVRADAGRLLAVCGPSGCGKSSLLALLGGLTPPTGGSVTLDGAPVTGETVSLRRRFGLILQSYGLVAALTAHENVAIVLQANGIPRDEIRTRVRASLDQVGLADVSAHLIEELSGGQQQRVAIARALVTVADVVLADEPTAELDAENRERILELLTARAQSGSIVVIASHDPEVIERCDDVLDLHDGART